MPLNPVCHYDMAEVQDKNKILYSVSSPFTVTNSPEIIMGFQIYDTSKEGTYYHIHSEISYTGNAMPVVIVYRNDWKEGTNLLWEYCNGTQDFTVFIPRQNFKFGVGVWMHGWGGYQVQSADSVSVHKFTVTEIKEKILIDSSGSRNHSTVVGDVEKAKDDKIGTVLKCNKGYLTRPPQDFIGVGKQWSHSRWIKIDEYKKDEYVYLYSYGYYDWFTFKDLAITTKSKKAQCSLPVDVQKLVGKWAHIVVQTKLTKNYCKKELYINSKLVASKEVEGDFSEVEHQQNTDMTYASGYVKGSLANLIFFDHLLTEQEILWLYLNPQYSVKNYTFADWTIDSDNPNNALAVQTPKYLGTSNVAPDGKQVFISNGGKTGNNTANIGDWILMTSNADSYKKGWCYRWTGSEWLKLDPQSQYQKEYTACLKDHFEKCGDMYSSEPQMFGALFCQFLAFNNAFGNFLEVKKLKIDNDSSNPNDFELNINKDVGILAKNKGKKIFEVSTSGNATFSGEINCQGFQVLNTNTSSSYGTKLFEWDAGADGHDAAKKIEKVDRITVPDNYNRDNTLITRHYGIGTYNDATIRCVRVEKYRVFSLTRVDVFLLDENGEKKGSFGSFTTADGTPYKVTPPGWTSIPARYETSSYSFAFYDYIPKQKIYLPNISYGKPTQQGVLYRDENGFLKIS